ncbi:unnamed protein product [Vitrella brassicaformis CCMP3155]|uniref:Uncharacterized protein n=1 Tax=Vitrella brassicaformis (strain CCMP3155) TaxID=1169540 RepID=A0A0G4H4E6_VITBC|nr:unnamed protein product [Vitrella brassicaformis CCMP3155]|eukprot:CEM38639.1 unnamed protein product [Vitrella brassicaformis CCMP3155]
MFSLTNESLNPQGPVGPDDRYRPPLLYRLRAQEEPPAVQKKKEEEEREEKELADRLASDPVFAENFRLSRLMELEYVFGQHIEELDSNCSEVEHTCICSQFLPIDHSGPATSRPQCPPHLCCMQPRQPPVILDRVHPPLGHSAVPLWAVRSVLRRPSRSSYTLILGATRM